MILGESLTERLRYRYQQLEVIQKRIDDPNTPLCQFKSDVKQKNRILREIKNIERKLETYNN